MPGEQPCRGGIIERRGVERDAAEARGGIGAPRQCQVQVDDLAERRDGKAGIFVDLEAVRFMAQHHDIGLRAMQEAQRHCGIAGMHQRALAFDDVPMIGRVGRRQAFGRSGEEIGDHRIDGDAAAADHDTGLAGGAEGRLVARRNKGAGQRQRGIFLAERAIGADGEQPLAGAFFARSHRKAPVGMADIMKVPAMARRRLRQFGHAGQPRVHAADDIEPGRQRCHQRRHPFRANLAAHRRHTDQQALRAGRHRRDRVKIGQPQIDRAARQPPLPGTGLGSPVAHPQPGLGIAHRHHRAKEDQIGQANVHARRSGGALPPMHRPC